MPGVLIRLQKVSKASLLVICQIGEVKQKRNRQEEQRCSQHDQDVPGFQTADPEHGCPEDENDDAGTKVGLQQNPDDNAQCDDQAATDGEPIVDALDVSREIACQSQNNSDFCQFGGLYGYQPSLEPPGSAKPCSADNKHNQQQQRH